jgi:hypothetical protein
MTETGQATVAPAERLIAAADLLDKRAGEATEGPWVANRADVYRLESKPYPDDRTYVAKLTALTVPNATYIATMGPEVGKAMAVVLRCEAGNRYEGRSPRVQAAITGELDDDMPIDPMLALADLLLAGAS